MLHRHKAWASYAVLRVVVPIFLLGWCLLFFFTSESVQATSVSAPTNLLSNGSFEQSLQGWGAWHGSLTRMKLAGAADGSYVVRVSRASGSSYTIDDWAASTSVRRAGTAYTASAFAATASRGALGKPMALILRERDSAGREVASWSSPSVRLTAAFQRLEVAGRTVRAGDLIDIYLNQSAAATGDSFYADNFVLNMVAAALTVTPAPSVPSVPSAPGVGPSTVGQVPTLGELALNTGQTSLGDTSRYQYVIIQDYEHAAVAAIRAANPKTKVLQYKNAAAVSDQCQYDSHNASGVSYCYANSNHPDWFLTDSGGKRFQFCGYPHLWAMDIGQASYQQMWLDNVTTSAKTDGFDGVFLDDVNLYPGHCMDGKIRQYSDTAYGLAAQAFMDKVSNALRTSGLLTVANVGVLPWMPSHVNMAQSVARTLTAFHREFLVRWQAGDPLFADSAWMTQMNFMDAIAATGTPFVGTTYGSMSDFRAMRYGRATFLLGWDGKPGSAFVYDPQANVDPYSKEWAVDIGVPTGGRYSVGGGFRRDYAGGTVILNPMASENQTFQLGGSYLQPDGTVVSSVTLSPTTAMILSKP